jgi:hypothetical protein
VPGPLEAVKGAFRVGEERVAAYAQEQPDRAGLDRPGGGIEAHRGAGDQRVTARLGLAGLRAGRVVGGPGLPAVPELREHERERDVSLYAAVVADVDPVDPVGVKLRSHQERRHGADLCARSASGNSAQACTLAVWLCLGADPSWQSVRVRTDNQ